MSKGQKGIVRGYFRAGAEEEGFREGVSALLNAGVSSGNLFFEPDGHRELDRVLELSQDGDTILVLRLTDICGPVKALFRLVKRLAEAGVRLRSVSEPWFEIGSGTLRDAPLCELIRELYKLSLIFPEPSVPRPVGRPRGNGLGMREKLRKAQTLYRQKQEWPVAEICRRTGINERTFYRYLARQEEDIARRPRGRKAKPRGNSGA